MVTVCWSVKGGSGVTVTSVALALLRSRVGQSAVLLVDFASDAFRVLGDVGRDAVGAHDWLDADDSVGSASLEQLLIDGPCGIKFLPAGRMTSSPSAARLTEFCAWLTAWPGDVVVDLGTNPSMRQALLAVADESLLVLRLCYLAGQSAMNAERATGLVIVEEQGRSMSYRDFSAALGVPVVARLPVDAAIANCVDSGLFATRMPRSLVRALRPLAHTRGSDRGSGAGRKRPDLQQVA